MKYAVKEELEKPHSKFDGSDTWTLTEEGIKVKDGAPERTEGRPITVESIWSAFHEPINKYSREYGVPVELIVAIIATESRGGESKITEEPGFKSDTDTPHLARAGLMQTALHITAGIHSINLNRVRQWLLTGENAIKAGTSLIARHKRETGYDPVLVAAAYRADGIRQDDGDGNRFKLAQWPGGSSGEADYCDNFIKWFNDFWVVIGESDKRPALSLWEHFHGRPGDQFSLPLDLDTQLDPTLESLDKYYKHTEQDFVGGYFPIGANTTWHGGIHLLGKEGDTVHAMAKGVVVRARMPSKDSKQDDLKYGSRNFILIRHGEGENVWYSLYYHLKSVDKGSEEANHIPWLQAQELEFTRTALLWKTKASIGGNHIHEFKSGDFATILHEDEDNTYYVLRPDPSGIRTRGYLQFWEGYMTKGRRAEHVLDSEEVVELNIPVEAGEVIGMLGKGVTKGDDGIEEKDILHWAVISPELARGFFNTVDDEDEDFICDSDKIFKLVDSGLDEEDKTELVASEIEDFFKDEARAKQLRPLACKFKSEWAVDWDSQEEPLNKVSLSANAQRLKLYNFWDKAKDIDGKLPASGHVWHYNPITYLYRQLYHSARANFSREMFEKNGTLLLPEKAISLLCGIGDCRGSNNVKSAFLIGHKGVKGDSGDAAELSKTRAEAVAAVLTLDEAKIGKQIDNGNWGDQERRIMLRWLKTDDGAPYYTGKVKDDDPDTLAAAVKAFQRANGLNDDGEAGKSTFAKMFERMLEMAGIEPFENVETIGAGETHAKVKGRPEDCVVEGLFWTTEVEPAADQYEQEPEATYKQWQGFVREEIKPGIPRTGTTEVLLRRHGLSEKWATQGILRDLADGQHLEPESYVYVFKNEHLWREFKVGEQSKLQEVDLGKFYGQNERPAGGEAQDTLELPVPGENEEMQVEIALAPVQWSWSRVLAFGGLSDGDPRKGEGDPDIKPFDKDKRAERLTIIDTALQEDGNWCTPDQFTDREDLRPHIDSKLPVCHVDAPFSLATDSNALVQVAIGQLNDCMDEMEDHEHYKSATLAYQLFFNTALHAKKSGGDDYVKQDDQSDMLRDCADEMSQLAIEDVLQVVRRKGLRETIRQRLAAHAALLAGHLPPSSLEEKKGAPITDTYPDIINFEAAFEDYAYLTGASYAFVWQAFTEHAGNLNFDPSYLDKGNDLHETLENEQDHRSPGSWYLDEVLTTNERLKGILFPKEDVVDCFSPDAYQPQEVTGREPIESAEFRPDAFAAAIAELAKSKDGPVGTGMGYKASEGSVKIVDKILSEFLSTFTKQVQEEVEAGSSDAREPLVRSLKVTGHSELADAHVLKEGDPVTGKRIMGPGSATDVLEPMLVDRNGKARQTAIGGSEKAPKWATLGGKGLPATIAAIEIFNLLVAYQVASNSHSYEDNIKAGHALFSVGTALAEAATALKPTHVENLAANGRGLGRAFGTFATGKLDVSIAKFSSKEVTYVKGLNGGLAIIGALFAFHDATKFSENHDYDAAQASVYSGVAQLWLGLATWGLLPGAGIALAVAVIAAVLVIWLSDIELERWAKYGPFTKGVPLSDHYRALKGEEVYAALLSIVQSPKVELKYTTVDETILGGPEAVPRLQGRIKEVDKQLDTLTGSLAALRKQTNVPPDVKRKIVKTLTDAQQKGLEEKRRLEKLIPETQHRLRDLKDKHGQVEEGTEILACEVHAPAWTLGSSITAQVTVASVDTDRTLLERVGTPSVEIQHPLDLYFSEDIRQGGDSAGPVVGKRYYFRARQSEKEGYVMHYRARAKHTVEEGIVLPFVWPEDRQKFVHEYSIDYKAPGWVYPDKVLEL